MARIRTIKPEFFTSEDIVSLTPLARLLYVALWCEADREGRMVWKPVTFKMRYFPGDSCKIEELCTEITTRRLVVLYGTGYAHIPSFKAHQHINPRESASQLPEPELLPSRGRGVGTRQPRDSDAQVGREGKGRSSDASLIASAFPSFWAAYPKKLAKPAAEKAFNAVKAGNLLANILADVESRKVTDDWQKDGGKYIPNPATYLNQRRWEDMSRAGTHESTKAWEGAR